MAPEEQKFEEGTYEWFQEQYQKFIFPVEEYKKAVHKMNELQVPKVDPDDGHTFSLAERITFLAFKYKRGNISDIKIKKTNFQQWADFMNDRKRAVHEYFRIKN